MDWYYLVDNVWAKFEGYEIARDTTQGLITSGIVTFSIPGITDNNTILPAVCILAKSLCATLFRCRMQADRHTRPGCKRHFPG